MIIKFQGETSESYDDQMEPRNLIIHTFPISSNSYREEIYIFKAS